MIARLSTLELPTLDDPHWLVRQGISPGVAALLWSIPVALTVVSAGETPVLLATAFAAVVCAAVNFLRPRSVLVTLPFFTLLAPMTGLLDLGGAGLLFSDLIFVLLGLQAAWLASAASPVGGRRMPLLFAALAALFVLSVLAGSASGYLVSLKPLIYLLQLAVVGIFTTAYGSTQQGWRLIMRSWIVASVMGSVILLAAYLNGQNLDTLKDPTQDVPLGDDLLALFRATYYYSGFHYILGLCIVWIITGLFRPAAWRTRLPQLAALGTLSLALVAMVNKTAIAAVLAASLVGAITLAVRFPREMARALAWIAGLGAAGVIVTTWQYVELAENTQVDLIIDRLLSASSLEIRLEVYVQAIEEWLGSPATILLGYGPDFLDNSGDPALAAALKTSKTTGYVEGTLDSAWLSYLVELGLLGGVLLAALFWIGFRRTFQGLGRCRRLDGSALVQASLFGGLAFLAIAMSTQMLGYSKITWLPLQCLLVAAMGLRQPSEPSGGRA